MVKPLYLAGGQQRLDVSSRKLLALGQVGLGGFRMALGMLQRRCSGCCQPQGLSLQTKELLEKLHPA